MDLQLHRKILDKQRGINREKIYGSKSAYFPYPHKLNTRFSITNFGTPVEDDNFLDETTNYEHLQHLKQISNLLSSI